MALEERDFEKISNFIQEHLSEWLSGQSLAKPPLVYEIELRERIVRVEEELKNQRELMKQGFDMMEKRFEDINPSLRLDIARKDLEIWFENPLLGVGPGLAKHCRRTILGYTAAAHTELTRLVAEHGALGLVVIFLFMFMALRAYRSAPSNASRAWVACLVAWVMAEMAHSAMRVAAISFVFGAAGCLGRGGAIKHPGGMVSARKR